jgi:hypothetical protein
LYRPAIEVHLAHDVALAGSRPERQKHLGPPHQTLGTGLTAGNLLQAGLLSCGQLYPGRDASNGATAVVMRASFRKNLAIFGFYDTMPLSV